MPKVPVKSLINPQMETMTKSGITDWLIMQVKKLSRCPTVSVPPGQVAGKTSPEAAKAKEEDELKKKARNGIIFLRNVFFILMRLLYRLSPGRISTNPRL